MQNYVSTSILLILFTFISTALSICWTSGPYHIAASALSVGVGNKTSASVCVYDNSTALNDQCPLPCEALLATTWGDCYCRDPDYHPEATGADDFIKSLTVKQIFYLLATNMYTTGATCRNWLQSQKSSWTCQ